MRNSRSLNHMPRRAVYVGLVGAVASRAFLLCLCRHCPCLRRFLSISAKLARLMNFQPLPYHKAVARHLETQEPDLWAWFRSDETDEQRRRRQRVELLKGAIELDVKGQNGRRHALASIAKGRLQLSVPVRLYQAHDAGGSPNAYLLYQPGEIIIVFQGRILELLTESELLDLLGHEMSHYKLYVEDGGRYHVAQRLLTWIGSQPSCPTPFIETARRLSLYTEIYCDIGGLTACEDRNATISGLAKTVGNFRDVDAATYLRQANEILLLDPSASIGTTHPELHIRVLALAQSNQLEAEAFHIFLQSLIDGRIGLGQLDVFEQALLRDATHMLIDRVAAEPAVATDKFLSHVREFRPGYKPLPVPPDAKPSLGLPALDAHAQLYLGYVLMDLATADADNIQVVWPVVVKTAETYGLDATLRTIARDEFKGRRKLLKQLETRSTQAGAA
jgi:Peptidase family M48